MVNICGIWCSLYDISMIVWSDAESYIQLSSSAMIVSQVVDSNIVFNHNSGYLVQLQLFYRW